MAQERNQSKISRPKENQKCPDCNSNNNNNYYYLHADEQVAHAEFLRGFHHLLALLSCPLAITSPLTHRQFGLVAEISTRIRKVPNEEEMLSCDEVLESENGRPVGEKNSFRLSTYAAAPRA